MRATSFYIVVAQCKHTTKGGDIWEWSEAEYLIPHIPKPRFDSICHMFSLPGWINITDLGSFPMNWDTKLSIQSVGVSPKRHLCEPLG